ncbi:hypothetical protein EON81_10520 [bacterium]|nr:MAG: hypothetical protein EON81_10520 [bacterium]
MPSPALFAPLLLAAVASARPERISLEGPWRLLQAERKIDIPATVPGVAHVDLMRAGQIPDPYLGRNDRDVQWVGEVPWTYAREFKVSPEFLRHRRIVLRCEGLDTLGTVVINGREVGRPDNMHRTWEFDAKPFLTAGTNTIRIDFQPIEPFLKAHEVQAEFPGKPVQSHGWGYVRKPSFQRGWDFSPKLITAGIWRGIGLLGWDEARLTDVEIVQDHRKKGEVGLDILLEADVAGATKAHVEALYKGKRIAQVDSDLFGGKGKARLEVGDPKLWWPNGMGPQNLYDVKVELRDAKGRVIDTGRRRIGLRTVTWFDKTEKSPLGLAINGRRFFAKGSNWVPSDSLLRANPEKERALVKMTADANMNLLRLWGGGHYEADSLFEACDEMGLLVWFEFKFADATYPSFDPKWLANVQAEARDNVRRVRHHPSVAVYSGNNEVIGFISENTTPSSMSRDDYKLLFHTTLRKIVEDLAPDAFYTPGSPEIGDDHYWDVWHGSATFASYRKLHGFMSEYGFQAFPVPRSVEAFTTPEDRQTIGTPVMLNHQRNWRDGNALILNTSRRTFRQPKDFDSTLWLGQINQAEGILTGVDHWRRDWPNSTASLVWQFNDPWPVVSWSMVDYYDRPKALYYRLKHAYANVALSGIADSATGVAELWVANDRPESKSGRLEWELTRLDGTRVDHGSKALSIPAGTSSVRAAKLDLKKQLEQEGEKDLLLWAKLRTPNEPEAQALVLFARPKDLELVKPEFRSSVAAVRDGFRITVSSPQPALWIWIELEGMDADLSDNFFNLPPGEAATIVVKPHGKTTLEAVRSALRVRSLYDTYLPGTEANPVTRPQSDGRIVATADNAEILGDGAILETGTPSNIGNWQIPSDSLRWTVRDAKPGIYTVRATVSIPENEAGSTFEVEVEGSRVIGTVPGTKSWTDYVEIELGTVTLTKGGNVTINLRPTSKKGDHVMNLRTLTLIPK